MVSSYEEIKYLQQKIIIVTLSLFKTEELEITPFIRVNTINLRQHVGAYGVVN